DRMSVNGVAKTTLTTDEQGDFTYNNSTLVAGDVVKAEMKINGAYTGAKEVTVVDNGIVPAITLQEIEETHTIIKGKTTLFNNLIRVSLNGVVKDIITSDETGDFSYTIGKLQQNDVIEVALRVNGKYVVSATTIVKEELIRGIYGTVPWTWEVSSRTLTFGSGSFPTSNSDTNILSIQKDKRLKGMTIQNIKFTKPVMGNQQSQELFSGLSEIQTIQGLVLLDTSNVTNMSGMFGGLDGLRLLDLGGWDTSNVTDMSDMFSSSHRLGPLDIGNWDTSKVIDMSGMFSNADIKRPDIGNWDTSSVTDMSRMFLESSFLESLDIGRWDTSKVTDMSQMFYQTTCLESLDIGQWDTSKVTDMSGMFFGLEIGGLRWLNIEKWNTSSVTDMSEMFFGAAFLTSLDLGNWDTSNVKDMADMFGDTKSLKSLEIGDWDTSEVTNMFGMFFIWGSKASLKTLEISRWDTSKVTNMSRMFFGASGLTSVDVGSWDTSNVTVMYDMFSGASSLESLDVSRWDTSKVTNMSRMFSDATALDTLKLGAKFKFKGSAGLMEKNVTPYTGKWKNTQDEAALYGSTAEFVTGYDGLKPGTYIREKLK
ncbi:BspA family leucine-rich repeat surface protein, partial [Listeria cornellensis]